MSQKIKKIAIAIDFSQYSKSILRYAFQIARQSIASVTIVHIINRKFIDSVKRQFEADHLEYFPYAEFVDREKKRSRAKLDAMLEICEPKDIPLSIYIGEGVPSVEILKFIEKEGYDFLIIGQKGRSDLSEFLSGGVSDKLFRYSPVPVMSIR